MAVLGVNISTKFAFEVSTALQLKGCVKKLSNFTYFVFVAVAFERSTLPVYVAASARFQVELPRATMM